MRREGKNGEVRLYPEYLELVKVGKNWEYDSIHTHEEISEILGLDYDKDRSGYYEQVNKAKEEFIRLGKPLETLVSVGYRVVHPDEQHRISVDELKRTRIHSSRALLILEFANVGEMSPLIKASHEHFHERTAWVRVTSEKTIRDLERVLRLPDRSEKRPKLEVKKDGES